MMYSGGTMDNLKNKIMKVLDAFNVDKYNIPEDYPLYFTNIDNIVVRDEDLLRAHSYLKQLDKYKFTADNFIQSMMKIPNI